MLGLELVRAGIARRVRVRVRAAGQGCGQGYTSRVQVSVRARLRFGPKTGATSTVTGRARASQAFEGGVYAPAVAP